MNQTMDLPITDLHVDPDNPRKTRASAADDAALVASIRAHGLLQPILVRRTNMGFMVIDGHRRFEALQTIADGDIGVMVPVTVRADDMEVGNPLELATAANIVRAAMHPLDECEAINRLIGEDKEGVADIEAVAQRFGRSPLWVRQRIKLSNLSPRSCKLFRDSVIGLEQAMALTLGTWNQQDKVLKGVKEGSDYVPSASGIRNELTDKKVPFSQALFKLEDYPPESIERDLFSDDVWLTDRKVFTELQTKAFDALVEELKGEGWADVIVIRDGKSFERLRNYIEVTGRIAKKDRAKLVASISYEPHSGGVQVRRGLALREKARNIKKNGRYAEDTTEAREVRPLLPHEWSKKQGEQASIMMETAIGEQIHKYDTVALWTLIGPLLGNVVPWSRVAMQPQIDAESATTEPEKSLSHMTLPQSLAEFEELNAKERMALVRLAAMHMVKPCHPKAVLREWELEGWFRPDKAFVDGWRRDQLLAYSKMIGAPNLIPEAKKGDLVGNILGHIERGNEAIPPLPPPEDTPEEPDEPENDGDEDNDTSVAIAMPDEAVDSLPAKDD